MPTIINTKTDPTELLQLMKKAKDHFGKTSEFYPIFQKWCEKRGTILHTSDGLPKVSAQGLNRAVTNAITRYTNHYKLNKGSDEDAKAMAKKMHGMTLQVIILHDFLDVEHTKENLEDFFTSTFGPIE